MTPGSSPSRASIPQQTSGLSRLTGQKGFLPLNSDSNPLATRNGSLQNLISRRPSSTVRSNRSERRGSASSDEDVDTLRSGLLAAYINNSERRLSAGAAVLMTPQMRSQRLIGNSNPRYRWERYFKTEEDLKQYPKDLRAYYERNNFLIQHYDYIDRLLDSSLPHHLIQEYSHFESGNVDIPTTITEESNSIASTPAAHTPGELQRL